MGLEAPLDLYHYQPQLEQEEVVTLVGSISTRMKASHSIQLRDENDIKRAVFHGQTYLGLNLGKHRLCSPIKSEADLKDFTSWALKVYTEARVRVRAQKAQQEGEYLLSYFVQQFINNLNS